MGCDERKSLCRRRLQCDRDDQRGVAWSLGYTDGEQARWNEVVAATARVVRAAGVPVTADIEAGYGQTPDEVMRSVTEIIAAGAVGVNLEDGTPRRTTSFLWLIAALFPCSRIILCRRDVRDLCLSCYFHRFTEGHLYAYDLADCAARVLEIDRLAAHWLRVLPLEILVIDYEKLVADLEGESRRLIEFLGLECEPACLDFHRTERPVMTASAWQVRQPLYQHSVGRWRRYARNLRPLLDVLAAGAIKETAPAGAA